ncbi:MAG TPA: NAD-dependent epimerase/dehydratase family protein [Acetobacteraceae bacterium]
MALYLVTGGAGFIGSHLCDSLLADGHQVRVLDDFSTGKTANLDPRCEVLRGDVTDPALVVRAMEGAAGCFHLAAIASVARGNEEWLHTHRANQSGTVAVLEAARDAGQVPVTFASSAAVYGNLNAEAARETIPASPLTAYGADKYGSELHARVAFMVHDTPTAGLRLFNVYGPRQDPLSPYSGVISIFARKVATGQPVTVHGDGLQSRDFVFVADVVAHFRAAMRHIESRPAALVLNVCTGRATTVLDLARTLGRIQGRTPEIVHGPTRPGDIRLSLGDPSAAIATLGLQARTRLEEGLTETLATVAEPA